MEILKKERKANRKNLITIYIITFPLIIFFGCATKGTTTLQPKWETLKERVMAYWNYKMNKEFDKTYNFEDPFYRKTVTLVRYIQMNSNPLLEYRGFEIVDINETKDNAEIELRVVVRAKVPGAKPFEHDTFIKEQWIFHEGDWYHLNKPKGRVGG